MKRKKKKVVYCPSEEANNILWSQTMAGKASIGTCRPGYDSINLLQRNCSQSLQR